MKKILVVDDEASIVTLLKFNLEKNGFHVLTAMDGKEALDVIAQEKIDLIILDLMLPKIDGFDVLKKMRQEKNFTPVMMLTARGEEIDKILGLELGADDYITKPFSPREVIARIKAIFRRIDNSNIHVEEQIGIGELLIDIGSYQAFFQGEELELTPKEFELLLYLSRHKGRVLTRDQLLNHVWNYDYMGDSRIVDVHISNIREKIEIDTRKPQYIKTIRGLGYKMEEPMQ